MAPMGEYQRGGARPERVRVLYVDGDPERAARTVAALERDDDRFETVTATTMRATLERLETAGIDCVVSTFELPDSDGLAVLEAVRDRESKIPFVLAPGPDSGSETLASDAISAGVTEYVRRVADGNVGADGDENVDEDEDEREETDTTANGDDDSDWDHRLADGIHSALESTHSQRQQTRQLRAIETAQEGIGRLDADGRFVYVNESYAECFGYEPADLLGEHWDILYDDDEIREINENVLPSLETAGDWRGETIARRADGSRMVIDHTLSLTDRGELICTVRDITERKERERDLERYETIIEALGDPVYTVDAAGRYAFVNDAYAELTGYEKDEIVGQPVSFLLDEPSVERGRDAVRALLSSDAGRSQTTYEIGVETASGDLIRCEDHLSLLPLDDGRYRGVAGVVRDITDRKARERELEQYETILQTVPDEIYTLDAEGHFTTLIPPTGSELTTTGYEPEDMVGEHVSLTVADEGIERAEAEIEALLDDDDREHASFELDLLTKDGDRVPNESHIAPLPADADRETFRGTVGVLRDITERKERERTLERQNERLDSFASIVSHDLRNPLNVAQGQLALARQAGADGADENGDDDRLEAVAQAHERMQGLIEDILAVAREDERLSDGDLEAVDLATLARLCWGTVDTDGATLETPTDAVVRVDRARFKRLLENLFRNAVEHGSTSSRPRADDSVEHGSTNPASQAQQDSDRTRADGSSATAREDVPETAPRDATPTVTLTVGALPDGTGFYVADDGPGIPSAERDRIFESGYSTTAEGTGFGLSIVDRIATAHGWSVTVTESEAGGARFEFRDVETAD